MADPFFMDEVSALKQAVQEASRLREYSGEEMDGLVSEKIADRAEWAGKTVRNCIGIIRICRLKKGIF